jgi:hypothetical protein
VLRSPPVMGTIEQLLWKHSGGQFSLDLELATADTGQTLPIIACGLQPVLQKAPRQRVGENELQ